MDTNEVLLLVADIFLGLIVLRGWYGIGPRP